MSTVGEHQVVVVTVAELEVVDDVKLLLDDVKELLVKLVVRELFRADVLAVVWEGNHPKRSEDSR